MNIQLTVNELQKVVDGLVKQPYHEVYELVDNIKKQYEQQTAPDTPTPSYPDLVPLNE